MVCSTSCAATSRSAAPELDPQEPVPRRTTKATSFSRGMKTRKGTPSACRRRAARSFAPTRTAALSSSWRAASAIRTTSRSTPTASCSPTTPTWNGTSARRGIGRRASAMCRRAASSAGAAAGPSGPSTILDSLPATLDVGPGSPTGVVFYDHTAFPERLQNTLFVGDWALGQIHAVKLERDGATYTAKMSTFLKGRPLNVTASMSGRTVRCISARAAAAPTAASIACAGPARRPPKDIQFGQGIAASAASAAAAKRLGADADRRGQAQAWATAGRRELERVLANKQAAASDRLRALDLLTYFGPPPSPELLVQLAQRRRSGDARAGGAVDGHARGSRVCRAAGRRCWPIAIRGSAAWRAKRSPIAATMRRPRRWSGCWRTPDRFVAFAARRALGKTPAGRVARASADGRRSAAVSARCDGPAGRSSVAGSCPNRFSRAAKRCCAATCRSRQEAGLLERRQLPRLAARGPACAGARPDRGGRRADAWRAAAARVSDRTRC